MKTNSYKYLYKLGHKPLISIAEFKFLASGAGIKVSKKDDYLFSTDFINANKTGSIIYTAEILASFEGSFKNIHARDLEVFLKEYFESLQKSDQNIKKFGLIVPDWFVYKALEIAKNGGVKKVNSLYDISKLNYGHWKQTKNWIVFIEIENIVYAARILNYSDQEFWQNLDSRLPAGEMSRGLINLKLARTLLNLTDKKTIWDPFCGHGRLPISGLDLKDEFYSSDIDGDELRDEIQSNFDYASNFWYKYGFRHNESKGLIAKLHLPFELDVRQADQKESTPITDYSQLAIVTEGYLGKNFKQPPSFQQIQKEWFDLKMSWNQIATAASHLGIKEIVFCLPFYQLRDTQYLPDFTQHIIKGTNYRICEFDDDDFLLYSRKDSFVGHYIVKLTLS